MTTPAQNLAGDSASAALATLPAATLTQSDAADPGSVGLVAPVFLRFDEPLPLLSGQSLASYELALKRLYPDSPEYKAYVASLEAGH